MGPFSLGSGFASPGQAYIPWKMRIGACRITPEATYLELNLHPRLDRIEKHTLGLVEADTRKLTVYEKQSVPIERLQTSQDDLTFNNTQIT